MREQDVFAKALAGARRDRLQRNAGEQLSQAERVGRGLERNQRRQRLDDAQAEAPRHLIGKAGRPHLWNRQAAGRQHQRGGGEGTTTGREPESVGEGQVGDGVADPDVDATIRALAQQHGHDRARGAVAEQLPERLLVIGNAMALDQRDEIVLRVTAKRRAAEVRIAGQKPVGHAVQIGEIAAPAARDQNLGADPVGMIEEEDLAAALAGRQRAHQSGCARAQDNDIERLGRFSHWSCHLAVVPAIRPRV